MPSSWPRGDPARVSKFGAPPWTICQWMVHPTDFSSCAFSCACHGCSCVIHNDVFHTQEVTHDFRHLYGAGRDQCHTPQLTALATVTGFFDTYDSGRFVSGDNQYDDGIAFNAHMCLMLALCTAALLLIMQPLCTHVLDAYCQTEISGFLLPQGRATIDVEIHRPCRRTMYGWIQG